MTTRICRWRGNAARSLLFLFVLCARPAAGDTYPRQMGVDAQHYVYRLTLRDDADEIVGEATAQLLLLEDGVTDLTLDLASGRYRVDWIAPATGAVLESGDISHDGGNRILKTPKYEIDIALRIKRI